MPIRFPSRPLLLLIAVACSALARPAAAQHCWPSSVALLVRDEAGALIHPRDLAGWTFTPPPGRHGDTGFRVRPLDQARWAGVVPAGTHALYWWGQGDCLVFLDEVVLVRGGARMTLRMNVRIETEARPGPSEYVVDTPPFARGTWELGPLPAGQLDGPVKVGAEHWRRVADDGGE